MYICELSFTLAPSARFKKEKERRKAYSCCQSLGTSARSDVLVFPTPFMGRAGGWWEGMQKAWLCLLVPNNLPSPVLPNVFLQTLGFSPLLLLNSLGSCWPLWLVRAYLVRPQRGRCATLEENLLDLSPSTHASLCALARMLSALNALSITRGREPSQTILELILQTSLFSCFSLSRHLITSLGKSLSFSALKPDKQRPNNSAIPLFLVYTFPYINPARKNYLSSVSDITHKPSDLFG